MKDRVLAPDEIPILWRLDEQQQAAFILFACKFDGRAVQIVGMTVYLAPISADFNPTFDAMDSPVCGMAELNDKILRRFVN